jgi:hypothetical protein
MRVPLVLGVVICLLGCGRALEPAWACKALPFVVRSDLELDCGQVRANVALVREVLDEHGLLAAGDFDEAFAGVPVHVRDADDLEPGDDGLLGTYGMEGITLTRATTAWAHEAIHHLDVAWLDLATKWHSGWAERGCYAATAEYEARYTSSAP